MSQPERTEIAQLGEFGLIRRLTQHVTLKNASTLLGIGDDGAVVSYGADRLTVVTTDLLIEGIHFDLMYTPLKHLGYKAVVVNLSDLYAMNALPQQITVSLAVSNRFSVEALEELYYGIQTACRTYEVDLIGGDTSTSTKGMLISVTALGSVEPQNLVKRSGAQVNDLICVTGDLGAAYLGLQLLEREKRIFLENQGVQPDLENQSYLVGRQLKPEARKDILEWFQQVGLLPTAMIDLSDGLSSDILHICTASGTGCRLFEEKIPIAEESKLMAYKFQLDPITCAMNGGEDYELLFTIRPSDHEKVTHNPHISVIGFMQSSDQGHQLISRSGQVYPLKAMGWNAFRT